MNSKTIQDTDADDFLVLIEDDEIETAPEQGPPWQILVVDDDDEVHRSTEFALRDAVLLERRINLLHSYSAAEARSQLTEHHDIAVILLDVVMETNDAGLKLVETIRNELGLHELRIILRTGQPGYAPELEVINSLDINDYRAKSELTQVRLLSSVVSALRSYQQIRTINNNRYELDQIINTTSHLMTLKDSKLFIKEIFSQVSQFFAMPLEGFIVQGNDSGSNFMDSSLRIIDGTVNYRHWSGQQLNKIGDKQAFQLINDSFHHGQNYLGTKEIALFFASEEPVVAYFIADNEIHDLHESVLELFCHNVAICLNNVNLFERLDFHAYWDPLTQLPNRVAFMDKLNDCLEKNATDFALGLLDLDHFNHLVESVGVDNSDLLLTEVSRQLGQITEKQELYLARIGADIFGLIGPLEAMDVREFISLFDRPLKVDSISVNASLSIGMVPLDGRKNSASALSAAHSALKEAKINHRGSCVLFDEAMMTRLKRRQEMLEMMYHALDDDEFFLVLQPQLNLSNLQTIGFESLIRWRNKQGDLISPAEFIPLAESTGLILTIGQWVFSKSCEYLRYLHDQGWDNIVISVNVSPAQLHDPNFPAFIEQTLHDHSLPATSVDLEITETMVMEEIDHSVIVLNQLKQTGVSISLDDFGTGFSSLAYLQRLNIDRLKIDRAFVNELGESAASERITRTIIELGRQLNLEVLAEGIESPKQAEFLKHIGCDTAQGFLYSKPIEFDQVEDWLKARPDNEQ